MDMDKKDMLERMAETTRRAYMKRFTAGSDGNISIRIQGQVYISPSGGCLGNPMAGDMIMLEADGFVPPAGGPDYGGRRPSKEAGMHLAYHGSRPDMLCLFHLYSPYSIAVAYHRQEGKGPVMGVPAYTPGYAIHMGRTPVVPYYRPGNRELAEAVSGMIYRWNSLLLANHGMVAASKSPEAMLAAAEEIEENAHLAIFLGDRGIPLDEEQIRVLFQTGEKI